MDEKLSEFREWLVMHAEDSFSTDQSSAYYHAAIELDERFGA